MSHSSVWKRAALVGVMLVGVACSAETAVLDGLPDAGLGPVDVLDGAESADAAFLPELDAGAADAAGVDAGDETVVADAGPVDAGAADAGAFDAGNTISPAALCPVRTMTDLYGGYLPTNPYGSVDTADSCVGQAHDVIIILGCPTSGDGTPSDCQRARTTLALSARDVHLGDRFIVTGGAVANQWVEADALASLLVAAGIAPDRIEREPLARHTDENLYYGTRIMEAREWESALVVSDDPGQLIMTSVCDSNCCVALGRLTVFKFPLGSGDTKLGHYARLPWGGAISGAECRQIKLPTKLMCTQLSSRNACAGALRLP